MFETPSVSAGRRKLVNAGRHPRDVDAALKRVSVPYGPLTRCRPCGLDYRAGEEAAQGQAEPHSCCAPVENALATSHASQERSVRLNYDDLM